MFCGTKDYPDVVWLAAAGDCKMGKILGSGTGFGSFFV